LKGYQQQRAFSDQDIAMVDTMVMLRRFALLAWIGSHDETDLASGLAQNFAQGSAELANRYVRTGRLVH
jgi:Ser/Thr protein kinase RdoA (MazF antagonist)